MTNRPLVLVAFLTLVLFSVPLFKPQDEAGAPRVSFFRGLLPLGEERFPPLPPAPDSLNGANAWLAVNERGLEIIRKSEGLRLKSYYLAGQWLIGYGHAATARKDLIITHAEADALLLADTKEAEEAVRRLIAAPINENEFSALVSLAYNMGPASFAKTQVVKRLNAGDRAGAADAFRHLVAADINGQRVALDALKRRRVRERALFLKPPLRA